MPPHADDTNARAACSTTIIDSALYGHLWGTDEVRAIFVENQRLQSWLDILAALAGAQADLDIIPRSAATEIASKARIEQLDLDYIVQETRATSHSTLGLIHGLQKVLSPDAGMWVYHGATVQDISDTWTALAMKQMSLIIFRDLRLVERALLDLALAHRDTPMVSRTHGQPGLPLTFGYKAGVWLAEIRRHVQRLKQGYRRWTTGQLGGASGTLSFWGDRGIELRRTLLERLCLQVPDISWTTARDNVAEFIHFLALACTTLAKIGDEVYELQRPEIGELAEPMSPGQVGSITMPHKRNPELSEHLDTLARIVRAYAGVATTGVAQQHERDGRGWKAEWLIFPEACLLTSTCLQFAIRLTQGLDVDSSRMRRNLESTGGYVLSEAVMAQLTPRLGKEAARKVVYDAAMKGLAAGTTLTAALREHAGMDLGSVSSPVQYLDHTGMAGQQLDQVVAAVLLARTEEEGWPR